MSTLGTPADGIGGRRRDGIRDRRPEEIRHGMRADRIGQGRRDEIGNGRSASTCPQAGSLTPGLRAGSAGVPPGASPPGGTRGRRAAPRAAGSWRRRYRAVKPALWPASARWRRPDGRPPAPDPGSPRPGGTRDPGQVVKLAALFSRQGFYLTGLVIKVMVALSSVHPSYDCEAGNDACDQLSRAGRISRGHPANAVHRFTRAANDGCANPSRRCMS
jgi:hypothetical protein